MRTVNFLCGVLAILGFFSLPDAILAQQNVLFYKDTLSTSAPDAPSNHTFDFTIQTDVAAGESFIFTPPSGFSVTESTASSGAFTTRNVEMYVNSVLRSATSTLSASTDRVVINSGSPGSIEYTLNTTTGVSGGDVLQFRMGNHTTNAVEPFGVAVGTSSTTTVPGDISGIVNGSATGTQRFAMAVTGTGEPVAAEFIIAIVDQVGVGPVDTTEEIPPVRFGGAPTGTVSGTTFNAEISVRTDEFATCRYSNTASTSYSGMSGIFDSSGLIVHSAIVAIAPETIYNFYVRCIDDENNVNTDDYLITFTTLSPPDGTPDPDGDGTGDGSGPNEEGSGGGQGTGDGEGSTGDGGGNSNSSSGGGGGGGGTGTTDGDDPAGGFENTGPYESGDGRVIINGYAFPGSTVSILVDGQFADDVRARNDGTFSITLDEIARGVYTFGIYATDDNEVRSSTFSTSFTVSGARGTTLSNINISPSIEVVPDPVDVGATAIVRGYTIPNASVTIENRNEKNNGSASTLFATSDGDGFWQTELSTAGLSRGTYQIRAKGEQTDGVSTNFSDWNFYGIGEQASVPINADLNRDGSVNLTDFSILLFWWGTDGGVSDPPADINQDGNVSLTDFSILLFNWTG